MGELNNLFESVQDELEVLYREEDGAEDKGEATVEEEESQISEAQHIQPEG